MRKRSTQALRWRHTARTPNPPRLRRRSLPCHRLDIRAHSSILPVEVVAMADGIRINRAPVLTLWAAVVAERLGYGADAAITLGRAVAGRSARAKARAIGIEAEHEPEDMRRVARREEARRARAALRAVHLLGRDIAV